MFSIPEVVSGTIVSQQPCIFLLCMICNAIPCACAQNTLPTSSSLKHHPTLFDHLHPLPFYFLLLFKEVSSARLRKSDIHHISLKTPVPQLVMQKKCFFCSGFFFVKKNFFFFFFNNDMFIKKIYYKVYLIM